MDFSISCKFENFDKKEIIEDYGMDDNGELRLFLAKDLHKRMVKYTPWRTGVMATRVYITPGKIVYDKNYAIYQYNGARKDGTHVVKKYTTAGTGHHWPETTFRAEKNAIIKDLKAEAKRLGG